MIDATARPTSLRGAGWCAKPPCARVVLMPMLGLLVAASLSGCGGGSNKAQVTATEAMVATRTAASATSTPASTGRPPGAVAATASATVVEVTGIVGTVNATARTIQIDRRSGADVTKIVVDSATVIRLDVGDTTTLAKIRPSDRIVARGAINDRGDALMAVEITVQEVAPGSNGG